MNNPEIEQFKPEPTRKPWGIWVTLGFSLIIGIFYFLTQLVVIVVFIISRQNQFPQMPAQNVEELYSNGLLLSWIAIGSTIVITGLVLFFAKLRKNYSIQEYLSLKPISKKVLFKWLLVAVIFVVVTDGIFYLFNVSDTEWLFQIYQTAGFLPLLYFSIVIAGPIGEEILFRGFLFQGLQASRLGNNGALVISSVTWAIIHSQYQPPTVFAIAIMGIILGYAKIKTNSIYVPIAMHGLNNLISLIQVGLYLR
jgi:membrane protease YdiL (CAAX protease family)